MGAWLTQTGDLVLPLIISAAVASVLLTVLALVLASADASHVVAYSQTPFRWS